MSDTAYPGLKQPGKSKTQGRWFFYWFYVLLLQTLLFSFSGRAAVTLTSSVEHDAACPGEVVVYTCTALRTIIVGWHFPPDINNYFDFFASSQVGQVQVFGDSQVVLTNRVLDPNIPVLADLTTTLTVTATPGQNGRVADCMGASFRDFSSLILNIASLPSPPRTPSYSVQHYGPHNVTVTVQWGYPEFDGGVPVDNYTISGTIVMTTTSQVNQTMLTLPYSMSLNIGVAATNCNGTGETTTFTYFEAGCGEPIPPSGVFIEDFRSGVEGSTITYSCSPGLVPATRMSVCTSMTWSPDPTTLECREQLPGESVDVANPMQTSRHTPTPNSTPTLSSTPIPSSTSTRPGSIPVPHDQAQPWLIPVAVIVACILVLICVTIIIIGVFVGLKRCSKPHEDVPTESNIAYGHTIFTTSGSLPIGVEVKSLPSSLSDTNDTDLPPPIPPKLFSVEELFPAPHWNITPLLLPKVNHETPHPHNVHQNSGEQPDPAAPPLPPKGHLKSSPKNPPPRPPKPGSSYKPTAYPHDLVQVGGPDTVNTVGGEQLRRWCMLKV